MSYNHNNYFAIVKYLIIINKQKITVFAFSIRIHFLICNEVEHNGSCNIQNILTDFKHNNITNKIYNT